MSAESTSPAPATERPAAAKDPYRDLPLATIDDLVRADGVAFGSPPRYGNRCAQLESFIDRTASLWLSGALVAGKLRSED